MTVSFAAADRHIESALGSRFSAAVLRVERRGQLQHERAFGTTRSDAAGRPVFVDTRFDLASLTKVAVAAATLFAVAEGVLALDEPLEARFEQWRGTAHEGITLRMLLSHTSGMQSGADYRTLFDRNVIDFALTRELVSPAGERVVYSDLGFIVVGALLERVYARSLDATVATLLAPLALEATGFGVRSSARPEIPATERDAWRGLVQGTVHDEKAHLMNGIAGHAGMFGTARDIARIAEAYLAVLSGRPSPLPSGLARAAIAEAAFDPVLRRGLGWALRTTGENSCGVKISHDAFGHTGFTGTCVWADPERDLSIVLLTNAVHFGRNDMRDVRASVCDAVVAAVDGA